MQESQKQLNQQKPQPQNLNPNQPHGANGPQKQLPQQQQHFGQAGAATAYKHFVPTAIPDVLKGEAKPTKNRLIHASLPSSSSSSSSSLSSAAAASDLLSNSHHHHHVHSLAPNHLTLSQQEHHHHLTHSNNLTTLPVQSQIGLSEYLRPPQNAPLFHPVKLPGRRPYPSPLKKTAAKPILPQQLPSRKKPQAMSPLPQPSLIVNHYRKPLPGLLKNFIKDKPIPLQPLAASVLLLGQPMDNHRKTEQPVLVHGRPKPKIPVPYADLTPQGATSISNVHIHIDKAAAAPAHVVKKDKTPIPPLVYSLTPHSHANAKPKPSAIATPAPVFKLPFDVKDAQQEPLPKEMAAMKPAINNGFKPDTVVVESGFRPILRHDGTDIVLPAQVALRREDATAEIDEAMETDTLFLVAQKEPQPQNFEPMFIPSPLDSTNASMLLEKLVSKERPQYSALAAKPTESTKLTDGILQQLLPLESEQVDKLVASAAPMPAQPAQHLKLANAQAGKIVETTTEFSQKQEIKAALPDSKDEHDFSLEDELYDEEIMEGNFSDELKQQQDDELEIEDNLQDGSDKQAQAAERIDTYYLPPDNRKVPNSILKSGAVVTYDRKPIVDETLIIPSNLEEPAAPANQLGLSKTEQLIRTTPQFVPFSGEIPKEVAAFLSTERSLSSGPSSSGHPSAQHASSTAFSTHALPTVSTLRPASTKLQIIKQQQPQFT